MEYVSEVSYLKDISLHHPKYILHARDAVQYLGSRECHEKYSPEQCIFTICDMDVRTSTESLNPRVVEFINEVFYNRPINYTFDKDELRELLETRANLLTAYSFLDNFDRPRICSNLKMALLNKTKELMAYCKEENWRGFWDTTLVFRTLVVKGIREVYLLSDLITPLRKYIDYIYEQMFKVWEEEYKIRVDYLSMGTAISSFNKRIFDTEHVELSLHYCTLKLEHAFVKGEAKEEYNRLRELVISLGVDDHFLIALQSVYADIAEPQHRAYEVVFSMLSFAKAYTINHGYPIPIGFEKRVLNNIRALLFALDNNTLKEYIADAFADAYLGVAEDISSLKNDLLGTLTYNVGLLKEFDIITEEERLYYIERGRVKYGNSNRKV